MKTRIVDGVMAAALLSSTTAMAAEGKRPTDKFRAEHVELHEHLDHVAAWVDALPAQDAATRRATAGKVVKFFREHLVPHAQWEERKLYALVDAKAGATTTATMRFEHGVVGRRIDELAALAARPEVDARAFQRAADRLLGLVTAHFDAEEVVLLPLLDAKATPAELDALFHDDHGG